jgi:hypothetical protein
MHVPKQATANKMRFSNVALEAIYRDVLSIFGKHLDLYESGNLDDSLV